MLIICLLGVLGILFRQSFQAEMVHFSNDGPLGAANSQAGYAWKNVTGYWQDLNWLGGRAVGAFLSLGYMIFGVIGPLYFSKFIAPISLAALGLAAWFFFRRLGFHPAVCVLGGLAAALNMNAFSISCWGLSGWTFSRASCYLALAALTPTTAGRVWPRTVLAGLAVGLGLMDGLDVGAIYSLYIAAFVMFAAVTSQGKTAVRFAAGIGRVGVVAVFAAMIAAQALTTLIGTQVQGIVGMGQDKETKEKRWTEATRASLSKAEALRLVIPGLFGYRIPQLYNEPDDSAGGSNYWGTMGATTGYPQTRHSGNGEFAGVLVTLIAVWGFTQSLRKKNNPFTNTERRFIWFWSGAAIVSLLLAFGRHAPFYQWVYSLPYFSAIRNPFKFLHPLHVALVILFACGLQGLWRSYLDGLPGTKATLLDHLKKWWKAAPISDRRWTFGSIAVVIASLVGWLMYAGSKSELVRYLQKADFPNQELATSIARFSLGEVGLFVLFLLLSVTLVTLILSGVFSRERTKLAGILLGLLLIVDLVRADLPWIVHYNYKEKYATNPIIDQLREKTDERRVTAELAPMTRFYMVDPGAASKLAEMAGTQLPGSQAELFAPISGFYTPLYFEWLQHHFQYFRIQSLDIIQMPRVPEFDLAYMNAFRARIPTDLSVCSRLWELTGSRYVLGVSGLSDLLNKKLDPVHQRFRVHTAFNVVPKPGVTRLSRVQDLTATPDPKGQLALFEFTGALPRARLYTQWHVSTNDEVTLQQLVAPGFDPAKTVLVADGLSATPSITTTNQGAGKVEFLHYEPKLVRLDAEAAVPSVLLLNDHHDPDWKVLVDGKPETLLRCNYIMRGVYLAPGRHTVEFQFQPSTTSFKISLAGFAVGTLLCGFLVIAGTPKNQAGPATPPAPASPKAATRSQK